MLNESYQQFAIVRGDTAQLFTDALNAKMYELRHKHPTADIKSDSFAVISYTETETTPQSIGDEYELQGLRITCQDCPLFTPIYKADGSEDKRIKYGNCPICEFGRTSKTSSPCSELFQMINSGEVKLCVNTESEREV